MGLKERKRNEHKKRAKRSEKRQKLAKKGLDLAKCYNGAYYIGHANTVKEA